jgi:hypothetical protein
MARKPTFIEGVFFRAPPGFNSALQKVAEDRCTTVGNLIRQTMAAVLMDAGAIGSAAKDRSKRDAREGIA